MAGSQSVGTTIQINGDAAYVGATVSWDNNLKVTVSNVYCNGVSDDSWTWRITGSYSIDNDRTVYAGEGVGYSFTSPKDGKTFVFGASPANNNVSTGAWTNTNGSFVVSSGSDSGDDSGGDSGGGGAEGTCLVGVSVGEGTNLEVYDSSGNRITSIGTVSSGDYIFIKCTATSGYTSASFTVSGSATYTPGYDTNGYKAYVVTGNVVITSTTGQSGDDNEGGSGGSTSNSSVYPTSGTQNGVTATFAISGSIVTVKVSSTSLPWRINGTNSGGDHGTYYISENRNSSGSFTAENGHAYAFQVCSSSGTWSDGLIFYTNIDSGGGSSGDDSGDSGGGTNSSLKTYTVTALGVTAEVTYTSGPEVTVTIKSWSGYSSIPYWRIKGVKSEGDGNTYLEQNNKSSNSFDSVDLGYGDGYNDGGKNYIFQVCKNSNWNNDGGDASKFHVDFSLAGEGGGESSSPVTLHIVQGIGTELIVNRIQSTNGSIGVLEVNTSHQVWYDSDVFEITAKALNGYELNYYSSGGVEVGFLLNNFYQISGNEYSLIMDADASIVATATLIASAHIFNKDTSSWNRYAPYIYNGSNWNRYRPYIYDGSSWNAYN